MRVLVAGATGALGRRLVPLLVASGHHVSATTRTPDKLRLLEEQGARAVLLDGLDCRSVLEAVLSTRPDVVVHEMTAIGPLAGLRRFDDVFAATNRLRTEGTRHLLAAARAAGVRKVVVQSYAGWPSERRGDRVKTEDDPLDARPPRSMIRSHEALRSLERMVTSVPGTAGIALRYGSFYGPGTSLSKDGELVQMVRRRQLPLVGDASGVWSFVHIDDAAHATQLAIERGPAGIYNIVDDDPAEVREWLPELARVLGAPTPRRVPAWLGRLVIGEAGLSMMTMVRGASNLKAKRTLGWQAVYPSWREGFRYGLSAEPLRIDYPKAV